MAYTLTSISFIGLVQQPGLVTADTKAGGRRFPREANRIKRKLEIHYTPKYGGWLNMAEIELNVLVNHGLSKRIRAIEGVRTESTAWNRERNKKACKINWRFITKDARIRLYRLYPLFEY